MQLSLSNSLVVPNTRSLALATIFETNFDGMSASPSFNALDGEFVKATNTDTAFGSTNYMGLGSNLNSRGWVHDVGATTSNGTGPTGHHGAGFNTVGDIDTGTNLSSDGYLFYESSAAAGASGAYQTALNPGGSGTIRSVRLPALDFSEFETVELTMFVHCFGAAFGTADGGTSETGIGIAASTSATSSSSAVEAGSGLGFTSRTAGGATFKVMQDNSLTAEDSTHTNQVRIGSQGQIQSANGDRYRYVTADLSAAAGQSEVYIWLAFFSTINSPATNTSAAFFRQDAAVDSIQIRGLK